MDCCPAKKRRLMGRLHTVELMEVDLPESSEEPMDAEPEEEPGEVNPPPLGQNHYQPTALRQQQRKPRSYHYHCSDVGSCPPPSDGCFSAGAEPAS